MGEINISINSEEVISEIMENGRLKEEIKASMQNRIVGGVTNEITRALNLEEFRTRNLYTNDYLTKKAEEILKEELDKMVGEYVQRYIKNNLQPQIYRIVSDLIESIALPRIQKFVEKVVVIDGQAQDDFVREQEAEYESQSN